MFLASLWFGGVLLVLIFGLYEYGGVPVKARYPLFCNRVYWAFLWACCWTAIVALLAVATVGAEHSMLWFLAGLSFYLADHVSGYVDIGVERLVLAVVRGGGVDGSPGSGRS
jgi:hypothetical protein